MNSTEATCLREMIAQFCQLIFHFKYMPHIIAHLLNFLAAVTQTLRFLFCSHNFLFEWSACMHVFQISSIISASIELLNNVQKPHLIKGMSEESMLDLSDLGARLFPMCIPGFLIKQNNCGWRNDLVSLTKHPHFEANL